ncbi:hypothetical protein BV22DRAFT_1029204 [Leucogyrophana mollusca]|uniref:Uncharacterized protein n=1 Tax=Leucogyrophana mollusca TaxID=85980 RepID=A0ACB8BVX1_9AGAM|nr:hypothetical protein BV22DRAFT_1029204 [Leucogyrophana mollusca]
MDASATWNHRINIPSGTLSREFRAALNLQAADEQQFTRIKATLRKLSGTYFKEGKLSALEQGQLRWDRFIKAVLEVLPIFRDNEDAYRHMISYTKGHLASRAWRYKRLLNSTVSGSKAQSTLPDDGSESDEAKTTVELEEPNQANRRDSRLPSTRQTSVTVRNSVTNRQRERARSMTAPAKPLEAPEAPQVSRPLPSTSSRPRAVPDPAPGPSAKPAPPAPQEAVASAAPDVHAVARFLERAGVEYLFEDFISLGIDSQFKLDVISSWPRIEQIDFLRGVQQMRIITVFEGKVLDIAFRSLRAGTQT